MNWNTCLREREAKPITPDPEMAASLKKTSANKAFSSKALELREETAAAKISLAYDAVRELLEALALHKKFKIYNHVCYAAFLGEVVNQSGLADEFDALRLIRNDVNYYGKDVAIAETNDVLERLEKLREKLLELV